MPAGWSYFNGNTALQTFTPLNNGNSFIPAVSGGYWSTGNSLNTDTPDFLTAQVNCSSAGETDLDCLAGDIVGHSPNGPTALVLAWTAPTSGTISNLSMSIWYAHSSAGARSNDFLLQFDASTLASGTVSNTSFFDRNNRDSYSNAGFAVNQGDVIALSIARSPGQSLGSLDGMTLDFTFDSSAPEPATLGCTAVCFAAIAWVARRRRLA